MIEITQELLKHIELMLDCKISAHNPLGNGEHNINYLLDSDKGKFVLRVYANAQFDNAENEYTVLKKLDGKFAPKVYFFDHSKEHLDYDYMVQGFVEGETLKKFSDEDIIKLAKILKEIHSIKDEGKKRDWKEPISPWSKKNILKNSKFLGDKFHNEMKKLYDTVLAELETVRPFVEKHSRVHLIHNDIIPENIIKTKKGNLVLVDWELAAYDYFFIEFGCVLSENNVNKHQEDLFLKEYGFGSKPEERKIIHAIKINRLLSCLSWLIERIVSIKQGKQIFVEENIEKYQDLFEKQRKQIDNLLAEK